MEVLAGWRPCVRARTLEADRARRSAGCTSSVSASWIRADSCSGATDDWWPISNLRSSTCSSISSLIATGSWPGASSLTLSGRTASSGDSALTSRLKAARRAIGDDGKRQQLISTARGIGYRFEGEVREVADVADGLRIDRRPRPPPRIRYLRSPDQHRIAWAVSGEGPTIVKAGTWLTHLDLEWESPIWAHWIDGLSTGSRLVRYDERGCGLSDWDVDEIGFDAWVEALELVVDAAQARDFTLLGLSQGGPVAIAYAARHPDLVA